MKNTLFAILFFFVAFSAHAADVGKIEVIMTGMKNDSGVVRLALVKNADDFKNDDAEPFMGASVKIEAGSAKYVFKDVPFGEYGVKCFHDENGSGKLDYGLFGIPKEEYGFSNNARSKDFSKAKFYLATPEVEMNVHLRK